MYLKHLFVAAMAMMVSVAAFGQEVRNLDFRKGFSAEVEVGYIQKGIYADVSSGYNVLPGLYVGAGVGLKYYDFNPDKNHFFVPTFAHIRYSILNRSVSPLIELKAGILGDFTDRGTGHFFRPAVGVKYKNAGIKVGYDWVNVNYDVAGLGKNSVTIGAFYKF